MKKGRIVLYHLLALIVGSASIAAYFFYKISALPSEAGLASVVLLPVAVVYIVGCSLLCLVSLLISLVVAYIRNR